MNKIRPVLWIGLFALFALGFATMTSQPAAYAQDDPPPANLLSNPSFEGAYSSFTAQVAYQQEACAVGGVCTTAQMPAGWFPWWEPQKEGDEPWFNRMPEWKPVCPFEPCPFPERLQSGSQAMQYFTFHSTHTAGAWQRVTVPENAPLKLAMYGQAWSSATDAAFSDFPSPVNMRIGIDPTGGTNPYAGSVVWSAFQNPYDAYQLFEVEATAVGTEVTVFMWSNPTEARKHNDIYWDNASLIQVGEGAPSPVVSGGGTGATGATGAVAAPAPAVVLGPTPTPNAQGIIEVIVTPGDSLWAIAARAGLTLDELRALNPGLGTTRFIDVGDVVVIGQVDPSGVVAEPEPEAIAEADTSVEGETEAAVEGEGDVVAAESGASEIVAEGGSTEEGGEAVTVETTPVPEVAKICVRAFDDLNADGFFESSEPLKTNVAVTVANGQAVVSNYITNGSEPFCIEGLEPGTYRVSRSLAADEVATNAADWGVTLAAGMQVDIDFGSQIQAAQVAAQTDTQTETVQEEPAQEVAAVDQAQAETTTTETTATDTEAQAASSGPSALMWIVGILLGVAALLLLGVGFIVLSARRSG